MIYIISKHKFNDEYERCGEALLALYLDKVTNQLQPAVSEASGLLRDYVGRQEEAALKPLKGV